MHWNNRIVVDTKGSLTVREVFYDNNNVPELWTAEPITPIAFIDEDDGCADLALLDIRQELELMLKCCNEPLLYESTDENGNAILVTKE